MYEPREDSFLLLESVKKFGKGNVLDMGTGSGILAYEASKLKSVKSVTAADIDGKGIAYAKKKYNNIKKIKIIKSNLFENIKEKFDTIIFNPPYLPQEIVYPKFEDKAIFGGKKGYELIKRFLDNAKNYLNKDGIILLLFSSLTNKKMINRIIKKNKLKYKEIDKLKLDFEELYVYLIS